MNLKQAIYIKTIAQCGSITAAARQLFVSQPSLSQMLRQVEQEIGMPIFDRSVTPLRMSYAGEKYLQAAEKIIAANTELENQIRELKHERSGRLRLGISVTRAMQVLPLVLPIFAEQYPDVRLELTESSSCTLEKLLDEGKIDLALAALESTGANLVYELLEPEVIGILAGRDTKLAKTHTSGTPVTLEAVKEERFVALTSGHSCRIIHDKLFRRAGFTPPILLETDSLEVGRRVTMETGCCMVLPNICIDDFVRQRRAEFFPLTDCENHRHLYACYRKHEFIPRYVTDFIQITNRVLAKEREKNAMYRI